jgi:hypothetical protein
VRLLSLTGADTDRIAQAKKQLQKRKAAAFAEKRERFHAPGVKRRRA